MLLSDIEHSTPLYVAPESLQATSNAIFGQSSVTRGTSQRDRDQTQGRVGELIGAKFLADRYEKDWLWLDDLEDETAWEYDFVIETEAGGAGVDVKTRRLSDIGDRWESDPDFWPRFYATEETQKTHIHSHLYLLIILFDEIPEHKGDFVAGCVVGAVNSEQVLGCEEYENNPDYKPVKFNIPSSKACEPTAEALEQSALTSIEACADRGGMPSVAGKIVTSSYGNGIVQEDSISDQSYWVPKRASWMQDDTTIPMDVPHQSTVPSVQESEPLYYPILPNDGIDDGVVKTCSEYGVNPLPVAAQLLSNTDGIDTMDVLEYYEDSPVDLPSLNARHVLNYWIQN